MDNKRNQKKKRKEIIKNWGRKAVKKLGYFPAMYRDKIHDDVGILLWNPQSSMILINNP